MNNNQNAEAHIIIKVNIESFPAVSVHGVGKWGHFITPAFWSNPIVDRRSMIGNSFPFSSTSGASEGVGSLIFQRIASEQLSR